MTHCAGTWPHPTHGPQTATKITLPNRCHPNIKVPGNDIADVTLQVEKPIRPRLFAAYITDIEAGTCAIARLRFKMDSDGTRLAAGRIVGQGKTEPLGLGSC